MKERERGQDRKRAGERDRGRGSRRKKNGFTMSVPTIKGKLNSPYEMILSIINTHSISRQMIQICAQIQSVLAADPTPTIASSSPLPHPLPW